MRATSLVLTFLLALLLAAPAVAQTSVALRGRVFDASGALIPRAAVIVRSQALGVLRSVDADLEGRYFIAGLPPGSYVVEASAAGFRTEVLEDLTIEVGRTVVHDFRLEVGGGSETVIVNADLPLVDRVTSSLGHIVTSATVQDIPLNGRRFTELGLLVPGAVAPSQTGFSTTPIRGIGAMAINVAGNREEAVGFLVNGVSTNNLTFGSLSFQPPVASIQEFRVNSSAFGAEYGHVSGAVVNILTRSGSNVFHAELFEFLRNDALDARNFFEFTSPNPHPFKRHQFGGSVGGPLIRGRTFLFASYEGLQQDQGIDLNNVVLSDAQRTSVTDPVVRRLIDLIPRANFVDAGGTPRYVGAGTAVVDTHRWTVDVQHTLGASGRLQAFYASTWTRSREPTSAGTTIPGFGHIGRPEGDILTVGHTGVLTQRVLNEFRFGRTTLNGRTLPAAALNPADFGIENGVDRPIGLPQFVVAGGLNFGGPMQYPMGRSDVSYVVTDTVHMFNGRHSLKFGGEYRDFRNDNRAEGTGFFNFPSIDSFLAGNANAFSITLGERRSYITQRAAALFAQDSFSLRPNLTVEAGFRYEEHRTPTERDHHFVVFDAGAVALQRVGVDRQEIFRQNRNVEPRTGVVWDIGQDGRTVLRAAYAWAADEPGTTAVRDTAANPPFARPLSATGTIALSSALATTTPAGLSPATVDPEFRNATLRSWNVNLQRQLSRGVALTLGYLGSRGTNLRITRNINQPVNGVRPFPALSASSSILPGASLGNIMQVESSGFSRYKALWISGVMRRWLGLQVDASYTLSESRDTNSLNSSGFMIQDSYDIPAQFGLSDFDSRHRFVLSAIYEVPATGHALLRDWQIAAIVQAQSGNPVNIVTPNSTLTGVPNTVRPDVIGPVRTIGSVDEWFDTSAFSAVNRFGSLGRNVVIGPAFHNTDLSIIRSVRLGARALQFRADVFNVFNHANFGPPGNVVGSPTFGKITRTRLTTGESGSSRQLQLAVKLSF